MSHAFRFIVGLALALIAVTVAPRAEARLVRLENFPSSFVQPRNVTILLPAGYDKGMKRYPVIYMHDGQNLFEPGYAYGGKEWGIDEAMAARKRQAIVVGVWNTNLRGREYLPTKVVANLPEALRKRIEALHGGNSLADNYLQFLVKELKPHIDKSYRTLPGRSSTSLMGSSMGGLISLYGMGEYPDVFGNAAALSIHWPLADPTKADEADIAAITSAFEMWLSQSRMRPGGNRFYTDHGSINLDGFYQPYSVRMDAIFKAQGWKQGSNWVSKIYVGTDHNEAAWRERVHVPLAFVLKNRK